MTIYILIYNLEVFLRRQVTLAI